MLVALLQSVPSADSLIGFDKLGIVAVIFAFIIRDGILLLTRKIVLGSTCELLLEYKDKEIAVAKGEAMAARADQTRQADDFNANLGLVLDKLSKHDGS